MTNFLLSRRRLWWAFRNFTRLSSWPSLAAINITCCIYVSTVPHPSPVRRFLQQIIISLNRTIALSLSSSVVTFVFLCSLSVIILVFHPFLITPSTLRVIYQLSRAPVQRSNSTSNCTRDFKSHSGNCPLQSSCALFFPISSYSRLWCSSHPLPCSRASWLDHPIQLSYGAQVCQN